MKGGRQTPGPELRQKIAAREAAERKQPDSLTRHTTRIYRALQSGDEPGVERGAHVRAARQRADGRAGGFSGTTTTTSYRNGSKYFQKSLITSGSRH
jgi:hypothetical protein